MNQTPTKINIGDVSLCKISFSNDLTFIYAILAASSTSFLGILRIGYFGGLYGGKEPWERELPRPAKCSYNYVSDKTTSHFVRFHFFTTL